MQKVMHIARNSGHTAQNDGQTMQNDGRITLNVSQGPKGGLEEPPRATAARRRSIFFATQLSENN